MTLRNSQPSGIVDHKRILTVNNICSFLQERRQAPSCTEEGMSITASECEERFTKQSSFQLDLVRQKAEQRRAIGYSRQTGRNVQRHETKDAGQTADYFRISAEGDGKLVNKPQCCGLSTERMLLHSHLLVKSWLPPALQTTV